MKGVLILIAIVLYVFQYQICEICYPSTESIDCWWKLKYHLYTLIFILLITSNRIKSNKFSIFIVEASIFVLVYDLCDRLFGSPMVTLLDYIGVLCSFIFSYLKTYRKC